MKMISNISTIVDKMYILQSVKKEKKGEGEKMAKKEEQAVCEKCGGIGHTLKMVNGKMKRIKCDCKKVSYKLALEPQEISDDILKKYIPSKYYLETEFNAEVLEEGIKSNIGEELLMDYDMDVEEYIDFLDTFIDTVKMGVIPDKSYFIVAPPSMGKKIFVYNVIRRGLESGIKVSRLINTQEIYSLMDEKKIREIEELYRNHEILLVNVGNSPNRQDMIALRYLMGRSDEWGKPLIVISRFARDFFIKMDANLVMDLGVISSTRGVYGELEQVGFNNEFSKEYRKHKLSESGIVVNSVADFKKKARGMKGEDE